MSCNEGPFFKGKGGRQDLSALKKGLLKVLPGAGGFSGGGRVDGQAGGDGCDVVKPSTLSPLCDGQRLRWHEGRVSRGYQVA